MAMSSLLKRFQDKWKSYRHRFVPWIAFNLRKNERSLRKVTEQSKDRLVSDEELSETLIPFFRALLRNDIACQGEVLRLLSTTTRARYISPEDHERPERGTIYQAFEPILFQSIWNAFVFRCIDSVLIDGNDRGISKMIYRSCSGRDRLGPFALSDATWLTVSTKNPLAVGQYVNNSTNDRTANVYYQEYDVPKEFPLELRQYLPNVNYRHDTQRPLRCVVLVALRDIHPGEELFSNYFTIVN
ncbi:SET domain-containing protein 9 isoform X3 [Esox lucius]|uniref:SET domain-containing protein 9 isoform X3 n=1 Tax=Esox lucius TaxID=8010 RepID=UPI001477721F|nr:SET domain-containing protein 9 isoform X3 [Esox lucius]